MQPHRLTPLDVLSQCLTDTIPHSLTPSLIHCLTVSLSPSFTVSPSHCTGGLCGECKGARRFEGQGAPNGIACSGEGSEAAGSGGQGCGAGASHAIAGRERACATGHGTRRHHGIYKIGNIDGFHRVISFYVRGSRFTATRFTDPQYSGFVTFAVHEAFGRILHHGIQFVCTFLLTPSNAALPLYRLLPGNRMVLK